MISCAARACRSNREDNGHQEDYGVIIYPGGSLPISSLSPAKHFASGATPAGVAWCARGNIRDGYLSDELVDACKKLIEKWNPQPFPKWATCIPSRRHPDLVPNFARRLAKALDLPFKQVLIKTEDRPEQKTMENSTQQARNIDGSLALTNETLPEWGITARGRYGGFTLDLHRCGLVTAFARKR